jgi:hypothetical protein
MLVRLQEHKGYTQLRLAESLCAASGQVEVAEAVASGHAIPVDTITVCPM